MRLSLLSVATVFALGLVGCNASTPANKAGAGAKQSEEEIKQAFAALQAAIKAKDADKVWSLLAKDSQEDAEREAKMVKEAFGKLDAKEKAGYEQKMALTQQELAGMNGKLFVKSKAFYDGETDEMPASKFDKAVVAGDAATVHYIEDDGKGQHEKRAVVREDGRWRFVLPIPKAVLK